MCVLFPRLVQFYLSQGFLWELRGEGRCSAWGLVKFSSGFPAERIYNLISLFLKSGAATTAWRTSGSWACSLTSPAAPCMSPSPPVSSRFPWDVASVTANAKSMCFPEAVRSPRGRPGEGGSAYGWRLVFFFLQGLHSLQRPLLRVGEGDRVMHTAGPWLQVSKGSGGRAVKLWCRRQAVLGRAMWNMGLLGREKCGKCLFLPHLHSPLKCLTNFFDVNSRLIGNCWKRRKKKRKELY